MKILIKTVSLFLVAALCFSLVACGTEEDVYERVQKYLAKEYPSGNFTFISYEKRNETSGRYEINARCLDDGTDFKIYMYSSIAVTDSYSVEKANSEMNEIIAAETGEELLLKFKYINWYDIYADRATDYRFREVELKDEFSLSDIKEIDEIKISESVGEADVGGVIYDLMYALCDEAEDNCNIEKAEFVFKIGRYTYHFMTSSKAVLGLGRDGMTYYIIKNITNDSGTFKDVEFEYFSAEEMEAEEIEKQEQIKKRRE